MNWEEEEIHQLIMAIYECLPAWVDREGCRVGCATAKTAPSCLTKCNDGAGVNIRTIDRFDLHLKGPKEVHTIYFFVQKFWPT